MVAFITANNTVLLSHCQYCGVGILLIYPVFLPVEENTIERLRGRLRELRALYGFTQEELAHRAGLDYKFYQSIEAGRRREIRVSTLEKIAKAYRIEVYQLLAPDFPEAKLTNSAKRPAVGRMLTRSTTKANRTNLRRFSSGKSCA
ncbi:MAG: helix-turn-helix transcriptional regulator [Verrucomicrobiales bacterium]|nr:helix-turn-helix transcriptional regulator [Verrucomicrobiales bacterium]